MEISHHNILKYKFTHIGPTDKNNSLQNGMLIIFAGKNKCLKTK